MHLGADVTFHKRQTVNVEFYKRQQTLKVFLRLTFQIEFFVSPLEKKNIYKHNLVLSVFTKVSKGICLRICACLSLAWTL